VKLNTSIAAAEKWLRPVSVLACTVALSAAITLTFAPTHAQSNTTPSTTSTTTPATTASAPAGQKTYPEFPDGPGKDELIRVCSKCHSPDNVIAAGQSRAGWQDTLEDMAGRGAEGSDDDFNAILNYLAKNYPAPTAPRLNVNAATAAQLVAQLMLTQAEADAIVQYRQANGNFKSLDDLKKVPNVDASKLAAAAAKISFN